jgi:hypothetical protein
VFFEDLGARFRSTDVGCHADNTPRLGRGDKTADCRCGARDP